jgi:type VI protein secretion system component VasK
MFQTIVAILWVILCVACWGAIFRKAGYSFWWGILGIVAIIPLLWLTFATWPIERQARLARAGAAQPTEEDAYALLDEGSRLERKKHYEDALALYQRVVAGWPEAPVGNDARIALDSLREKMQREAAVSNGA